MSDLTITRVTTPELPDIESTLAGILHACVQDGASVGFILPFEIEAATDFWRTKVFPAVTSGDTDLFIARQNGVIAGTVQLGMGLLPNQPHRADVAKMLVHPDFRRNGIALALMATLEARARDLGKTLLVLDTRSGDAAQPLYASLGFQVAGEIPGYCRNPFHEIYEPTTYMYKALT